MNFVVIKQKLSLISIIVSNLKLISFFVSEIQAFLVKYRPVCKILTKRVIKRKMVSINFMYDGLSLCKVSISYHFWNLSYKPVCKIHILVNLVCKIHDAWISFAMRQKLLSRSIMVQSFNIIRLSGGLWILSSMRFFKNTALKYYQYMKYYHYY